MAFIPAKGKSPQIGDWIVTTRKHSCLAGTMEKGTLVKVIAKDYPRGYGIEDEYGNRVIEIGWTI